MTGVRITSLPAANAVVETDILPVVQGSGPSRITRRTTVAAVVDLAVQGASGFAVGTEIVATGGTYTLVAADRGLTRIWDDSAGLTVIVPDDLPAGFQVALTQAGAGGITVQGAGGVTIAHYLDHNGTAGPGATIVLLQGLDAETYSLGGNTGFAVALDPPVVENAEATADENAALGTIVATMAAQRAAGAVTWAITAGNTGGRFAIGAATGIVTVAATLAAGDYSLTVSATNGAGSDTATLAVAVVDAGYEPIDGGAGAWFQPRRAATRAIIDPLGDGSQAYAYILDAEQRGPQLYAASDPFAYPRPTLVEAGAFNGLDTASFTATTARLIGNQAVTDVFQNRAALSVEMVVSPASLSAASDLLTQRISGVTTLFAVSLLTGGQVQVSSRRTATDTLRTVATETVMRLDGRHYLYVGINYGTGLITVQIDDVVETFAGTWTAGTGSSPSGMTGVLTVGGLTNIAAMRMAELALYPALRDLGQRTANRAFLLATYDLNGTSVPGVPTEAPSLLDGAIEIDDGYLAGRFVQRIRVDNYIASGATTYAITSGNTGGDFAIDDETGDLTVVNDMDHTVTASYSLVITATNALGSDTGTFAITVSAAGYNPALWGARFWGEFGNDAVRTVIDQSGTPAISELRDIAGSSATFEILGANPGPTLVSQWDGQDVATFTATNALLSGNTGMKAITRNASRVAAEMALSVVSVAATRDVLRFVAGGITRWKVDVLSTGQLRVTAIRINGEATRSYTTTMTITTGARNYLFVAVDWTDGTVTVQLNGTTETSTLVWDNGYGQTSDSAATEVRLGRSTVVSSIVVAELAIYQDTHPNAAERAINRGVLQAKYTLA